MAAIFQQIGQDDLVLQTLLTRTFENFFNQPRSLFGTGMVVDNQTIPARSETFIGQLSWRDHHDIVINTGSITNPAAGDTSSEHEQFGDYVKRLATYGRSHIVAGDIIRTQDNFLSLTANINEAQEKDHNAALLAQLKGISITEAIKGVTGAGGQTFTNDVLDPNYGFYVDLGANQLIAKRASDRAGGAWLADPLVEVISKAWKDYESPYMYFMSDLGTITALRQANLIQDDKVRDGQIDLETFYNGKFRIALSRARMGLSEGEINKINTAAATGREIVGKKVSYLVLPGSFSWRSQPYSIPFEIESAASSYKGAGSRQLWARWAYVLHPYAYNWRGAKERFAEYLDYSGVNGGQGQLMSLPDDATGSTQVADALGNFERNFKNMLNCRILTIFHS